MPEYYYNQYIGPETLEKEYKLFTLHFLGNKLDPNNESYCEELMTSGKWIFNNSVEENLKYYIEYYLPKYASSFLNSSFQKNESEMYFGINNDGFIQGIPYQGDLNKEMILMKVKEVLSSKLVRTSNLEELTRLINVELIKINTSEFTITDNHLKFFEEYFNSKKDYDSQINIFKKRKKIWCDLMSYYGDKLTYLLNNETTRKLILKFVIEKDSSRTNIINQLKSNKIFKPITGDEIFDFKKDKETIWHWVTEWKDFITDYIKEFKPNPPPYTQRMYPINILITMIDMIPHWLDKDNVNLYLIKFNFKKSQLKKFYVKYKSDIDYYECLRTLNEYDEPISQLI